MKIVQLASFNKVGKEGVRHKLARRAFSRVLKNIYGKDNWSSLGRPQTRDTWSFKFKLITVCRALKNIIVKNMLQRQYFQRVSTLKSIDILGVGRRQRDTGRGNGGESKRYYSTREGISGKGRDKRDSQCLGGCVLAITGSIINNSTGELAEETRTETLAATNTNTPDSTTIEPTRAIYPRRTCYI